MTLHEFGRPRRRRHPRFDFENVEGELRILRDAVVRIDGDEIVAICDETGTPGERLGLERMEDGVNIGMFVRVVDCRPVMIEGAVRHQLRLSPCGLNLWRAGDSDDEPV